MLSILIPVYNYNIYPLVKELQEQCKEAGIIYEIIVLDDCSNVLSSDNHLINQLSNCSFFILEKNIGRSAIRNLLAKKAQFENILFLDADTFPANSNFISTYISKINEEEKVVYGGIIYQPEKPEKAKLLRWIYGKSREGLGYKERTQNPYISFLTLNFLIKKNIFATISFNEDIPNLRHEDTLFSYNLKQEKIKIEHIDNPVVHLGLETSTLFLRKSEESVVGLHHLVSSKLLPSEYVKLSLYYQKINTLGLHFFAKKIFKITKQLLRNNLISEKPSLLLLDLYRLGYYATLKK